MAGHDFSPQWPGVVRAVQEARTGRDVTLGMDWMYWSIRAQTPETLANVWLHGQPETKP